MLPGAWARHVRARCGRRRQGRAALGQACGLAQRARRRSFAEPGPLTGCVRARAGTTGSVNYLVDPKFREQFEIAHATPRYEAALAAAPADFVGTEERIVPLVELLCAEMSAAFRAAGATLPPWRQAGAMLSKWRPRRSEDAGVKAAGAGPATGNVRAAAGGAPAGGGGGAARPLPAARRHSVGGPAGADWRGVSRELSRARAVAARSSSLLAAELEAARKLCREAAAAAAAAPAKGGAASAGGPEAPAKAGAPKRRTEAPCEPGKPAPGVFAELRRAVAARATDAGALASEQSAAARQMLTGF